jgi:hypothetical protein
VSFVGAGGGVGAAEVGLVVGEDVAGGVAWDVGELTLDPHAASIIERAAIQATIVRRVFPIYPSPCELVPPLFQAAPCLAQPNPPQVGRAGARVGVGMKPAEDGRIHVGARSSQCCYAAPAQS